jgi:hypothetical protein
MYISKIRLDGIRGFRNLEIDLARSDGHSRLRTLIIGKNGTQKTTLLRAIAIGLCELSDAITLLSQPNGRYSSDKIGTIDLHLVEGVAKRELPHRSQKTIYATGTRETARQLESNYTDKQPFVCGYGAGRFGFGSEVGREYRIADSVFTLFDYGRPLLDPELTLRRMTDFLGSTKYNATLAGIKRVLGLGETDEIRLRQGGGIEIRIASLGEPIPLQGWADGYRLTFSWLLDLYGWAMRADAIDEVGDVRGIVLIDEIDQHLHPSMQAKILPLLAKVLPKVQIFATTHSPLVALGACPEELVVLRREGAKVVAEDNVPDFTGYSAEDMLVDERLFDSTVYAPEMNEKLSRYKQLAAITSERRSPEERQELRDLAAELGAQQLPEVRESETMQQLKRLVEKHHL